MAALFTSKITDMVDIVDKAVSNHLIDIIKAKLMAHAEEVVEQVAIQIAEELSHKISAYAMPSGDVNVNVWVGPKDDPKKMVKVSKYEEVAK